MNKKQLENYLDYKNEVIQLQTKIIQLEFEMRPKSHSVYQVKDKTQWTIQEQPQNQDLAQQLNLIKTRIKILKYLIKEVSDFIKKLPEDEQSLINDLYVRRMSRTRCSQKYHCDVRSLSRMVNKIILKYSPYNLSNRT